MPGFSMFAGDSKTLQVALVDEAGVPIDVSAPVTMTWELSKRVTSTAILIKTLGSGITVIDGPAGKFNIELFPADTADLKGDYYQEIEINDRGNISTVLSGTVAISPDLIKVAP